MLPYRMRHRNLAVSKASLLLPDSLLNEDPGFSVPEKSFPRNCALSVFFFKFFYVGFHYRWIFEAVQLFYLSITNKSSPSQFVLPSALLPVLFLFCLLLPVDSVSNPGVRAVA